MGHPCTLLVLLQGPCRFHAEGETGQHGPIAIRARGPARERTSMHSLRLSRLDLAKIFLELSRGVAFEIRGESPMRPCRAPKMASKNALPGRARADGWISRSAEMIALIQKKRVDRALESCSRPS